MTAAETDAFARECATFARYLGAGAPSPYVIECYRRGLPVASTGIATAPIDRLLDAVARLGGVGTRIADGYARLARAQGPLRRRLTLLLAVLENAPQTFERYDRAATGPRGWILVRLVGALAASGLVMIAGVVVLGAAHVISAPFGRAGQEPAR